MSYPTGDCVKLQAQCSLFLMPASPFLLLCLDYILAASQEFRQVDGCFELKSVVLNQAKFQDTKRILCLDVVKVQ